MPRYDDDGTRLRFRQRFCSLTVPDQDAFSDAMREMFPGIVIVDDVDPEAGTITEIRSISELSFVSADFWVLPPGWRPEWGFAASYRRTKSLLNGPRKWLWYREGREETAWISERIESFSKVCDGVPTEIAEDRRITYMPAGEIQSCYREGDEETRAFLSKIFSWTTRNWTNRYEIFDLHTGEPLGAVSDEIWAGPDSIRRGREDPDFYTIASFPYSFGHRLVGYKPVPRNPRQARHFGITLP